MQGGDSSLAAMRSRSLQRMATEAALLRGRRLRCPLRPRGGIDGASR